MKTATGGLAVLLGGIGVLACIALCGLAWWAAREVAQRADRLADRVEQGLAEVDVALDRIGQKFDAARAGVRQVRTTAERVAAGKADDDPNTKDNVERLLDTLAPFLDRAEALAESVRSLAALLQTVAHVADQFDQLEGRAANLRSVADSLTPAAETLATVRERAQDIRRGGAAPKVREVVALADRAAPAIDRLAGGLSDARQQLTDTRGALAAARAKVRAWTVAGPAVATLVLLWIGLGQVCLIGWGRRRLAGPTPASS
jgi:methyl-accepting chemotaxis protein